MNKVAPNGECYVCEACGKVSRDEWGSLAHSHGWDESCILNCVLTDDPKYVRKLEDIEASISETSSQKAS